MESINSVQTIVKDQEPTRTTATMTSTAATLQGHEILGMESLDNYGKHDCTKGNLISMASQRMTRKATASQPDGHRRTSMDTETPAQSEQRSVQRTGKYSGSEDGVTAATQGVNTGTC
jgi:hypothetical protein